jgi:hypothetical protein
VPLRSSDVADIGGADWGSQVRVKSPRAQTLQRSIQIFRPEGVVGDATTGFTQLVVVRAPLIAKLWAAADRGALTSSALHLR